jgi:hypothetical protein
MVHCFLVRGRKLGQPEREFRYFHYGNALAHAKRWQADGGFVTITITAVASDASLVVWEYSK